MITGINELKVLLAILTLLTTHISCECKCKFEGRKCNSNQWWNNYKCWCECKKHHLCEKRLYLEFCYMLLQIWQIFSKYYWRFSDYIWRFLVQNHSWCKTILYLVRKNICTFKKIYVLSKVFDGIRYLVLFGSKQYDAIYYRIRYLISKKVVLQILLAIILQESELIHIVLCL